MKKDWNNFFMGIAELYGEQSSCSKIKVGAIIVRNRRIISTGYNGTPSGKQHCNQYFYNMWDREFKHVHETFDEFVKSNLFLERHREFSNENAIHAEQNAINFSRQDVSDCDMYVTYSPCLYCAKNILSAGIQRVYYKNIYGNGEGIKFLKKNGVSTIQLD